MRFLCGCVVPTQLLTEKLSQATMLLQKLLELAADHYLSLQTPCYLRRTWVLPEKDLDGTGFMSSSYVRHVCAAASSVVRHGF